MGGSGYVCSRLGSCTLVPGDVALPVNALQMASPDRDCRRTATPEQLAEKTGNLVRYELA